MMRGPRPTVCAKQRGDAAMPTPAADNMASTLRRENDCASGRGSTIPFSEKPVFFFIVFPFRLAPRSARAIGEGSDFLTAVLLEPKSEPLPCQESFPRF